VPLRGSAQNAGLTACVHRLSGRRSDLAPRVPPPSCARLEHIDGCSAAASNLRAGVRRPEVQEALRDAPPPKVLALQVRCAWADQRAVAASGFRRFVQSRAVLL